MSSKGGYTGTGDRADLNNHSNQCNPNHSEYRGYSGGYSGTGDRADLNNHSNQCNPDLLNFTAPGSNDGRYRKRQHE